MYPYIEFPTVSLQGLIMFYCLWMDLKGSIPMLFSCAASLFQDYFVFYTIPLSIPSDLLKSISIPSVLKIVTTTMLRCGDGALKVKGSFHHKQRSGLWGAVYTFLPELQSSAHAPELTWGLLAASLKMEVDAAVSCISFCVVRLNNIFILMNSGTWWWDVSLFLSPEMFLSINFITLLINLLPVYGDIIESNRVALFYWYIALFNVTALKNLCC